MTNPRINQIQHYNPTFDLVRGLASLAVFFSHLKHIILSLIGVDSDTHYHYGFFEIFGILGVEFFFALSGLLLGPLLYKQFQKPEVVQNLKTFVLRRWYRTLPTYFAGFLLFYIIFTYQGFEIPDNWIYFLFFLQSPLEFDTHFYSVSWSMAVEEVFYIVFPAFLMGLWFFKKDPDKIFLCAAFSTIIFCFLMRVYQTQDFISWDEEIRRGFLLRLDAIAIGVLVGIYCNTISKTTFWINFVFLFALSAYMFVFFKSIEDNLEGIIFLHLFFTLLPLNCAIVIKYLVLNLKFEGGRITTFFADISYPLYIFHLAIMYIFFPEGTYPTVTQLVFYIWTCIGVSYVFFRYVETPILKRRPTYIKE